MTEIELPNRYNPVFRDTPLGGQQVLLHFQNGYGASVVHSEYSYGVELAVIIWTSDSDYSITYDTPITDDVLGHLTPETLEEALTAIEALPFRTQNGRLTS